MCVFWLVEFLFVVFCFFDQFFFLFVLLVVVFYVCLFFFVFLLLEGLMVVRSQCI